MISEATVQIEESAMTRYEFAAGLNACLDRISKLVDDLTTLQRLQEEFAAELAQLLTLGGY